MQESVVYRSDTLCVRVTSGTDTSRWVVTFDNYGSPSGFDRPSFGEQFLISRGVSVVAVLGRGNDWYQYNDLAAALAAARLSIGDATTIMTYGSSMGGYAAIRFADRVGATACLALSPQYSNDPKRTPFEWRWPQEAATIEWLPELGGPLRCACRPVIVYDNRSDDAQHVALIRAEIPIVDLPIGYTGHPITTFLSSIGMLERLVFEVLDGTLDAPARLAEAHQLRAMDPVYLSELARLQPPRRMQTGIRLARRALAGAPENSLMLHILAKKLSAAGEHEEAIPLHRRAVEISQGHLGYSLPLSQALASAGHHDQALALARELARDNPSYAQVHAWLGNMLWADHDRAGAYRSMRTAARMAPENRYYASMVLRFRLRLPPAIDGWLAQLPTRPWFVRARRIFT